jgi:integrase
LESLNGVFTQNWKDTRSLVLILIIYSSDLRNSEIERLKLGDIISIDDCRFIDVKKSKTKNGERLVPLHPFVYDKIMDFIKDKNLSPDDFIISKQGRPLSSKVYKKANIELAEKLNMSETELAAKNLTFYSGRHFWKTLMNADSLGEDIEELFMGHSVSSNISKRYNHTDKRGKNYLLQKTRQVYSILDKSLFQAS